MSRGDSVSRILVGAEGPARQVQILKESLCPDHIQKYRDQ